MYDIAVIGGGIVGVSTARAILSGQNCRLVVLEAEDRLAAHQTGNNSGVIHSGLYYKPGSLKARNCVSGRDALYAYCEEKGIPYDRCGKIVVATSPEEIPRLDELEKRGRANGLQGMKRMSAEEAREREPHVACVDALLVRETGIMDFTAVTEAFAGDVRARGGETVFGFRVSGLRRAGAATAAQAGFGRDSSDFVVWSEGREIRAKNIINCAGLQCDRIARLCGSDPGVQIVPFRGEYYELTEEKRYLVKHLIYPVPDPRFPFLGVHFTRMIGGGIEAGPNAVLALKREGYSWRDISLNDMLTYATYGGFWKMAAKFWNTGFAEVHRSLSKKAFVRALQGLVPEVGFDDVTRCGAGVRAQALGPDGKLIDDFRIVEDANMIHVLNAPSPAATSSISIGETIAAMAHRNFRLN
ncbi:MAG: L-2-hydroxyglutarate oxidase [Verrucomicrobia bacterium]|nr:L-2-hydroxyglutarate oxidase [Verrucomicrobiota bacterium]